MAGPARARAGVRADAAEGPWWVLALGLAVVAAIAVLDVTWGQEDRVVIASVVVAPFITALLGTTRQTATVAVVSVLAVALSGAWNDNFGEPDCLVRIIVVIGAGVFAYVAARSRGQLAADRPASGCLRGAAEISDEGPPPSTRPSSGSAT